MKNNMFDNFLLFIAFSLILFCIFFITKDLLIFYISVMPFIPWKYNLPYLKESMVLYGDIGIVMSLFLAVLNKNVKTEIFKRKTIISIFLICVIYNVYYLIGNVLQFISNSELWVISEKMKIPLYYVTGIAGFLMYIISIIFLILDILKIGIFKNGD